MIEPRTLKGFRDFLPQQARKRQYVMDTLKKVFELYGFEPLETPVLEYEDILAGKYGEEGDKLMYRFADNGGRNVAMRYDQTVPLARVTSQYGSQLPMPFKRYQMQNVWRAENTQRGRYREFMQCDIDTVGSSSAFADSEILSVVYNAYSELGFANFRILVNDRNIFQGLEPKAVMVIDKLKKIGEDAVVAELEKIGVSREQFNAVKNAKVPDNLQEILTQTQRLGLPETALQFDPTLARGLDYYTGLIFEVVCEDYPVGSLGGGGRYDTLIGMFQKNTVPAVGCAVGFDRTIEAMDSLSLFPAGLTTTMVLVTIFSKELANKSLEITSRLRSNTISTEIYLDTEAKMDKQLKYADKKQIPYVIIIGPDEVKEELVTVKNMITGEQKRLSLPQLVDLLMS